MNHRSQVARHCGWLLSLIAAAGCQKESAPPAAAVPWSELRVTLASDNPQLRQELGQLQQERQLPWQWEKLEIVNADNAAQVLAQNLVNVDCPALAAEALSILPEHGRPLSLVERELVADFLVRHAPLYQAAAKAAGLSDCSFGVDPAQGYSVELDFIAHTRLATRLLALQAAQASVEGQATVEPALFPSGSADGESIRLALDCIQGMFRLAAWMAREPHVICRIEAVHLRAEACDALQRLTQHCELSTDQLRQLAALVEQTLQDWPSDVEICQLDRVLGLQVYEYIRAGTHEIALCLDGSAEDSSKLLNTLRKLKPEHIDQDQLFYLRHMQQLIQRATGPWAAREQALADMQREAEQMSAADDFPVIAMELALRDAAKMHQWLTWDRAQVEAWAIALSAAHGEKRPDLKNSPYSGQAYRIVERPDHIAIWGHGAKPGHTERPVVIKRTKEMP